MPMGGGDARNVQVNLTANVSPYQRAMQDAAKATNVALVGVTKLGKGIDSLVKSAGRKITIIGVSDIAALTAAGEAANRLDVAMSQVRSTSAVTGQSVGALQKQVMNLSKSIPDSTTNIARLVGQIQALGVQGTQNISNLTVTAERLAAATNTAPGELFQSLLQLNRQMGNGLQTLNNYSSSLVTLAKTSGSSASDITGFATSISSVAQSAGYTETQILGMAAAFTRAGADSSAAANVFTTLTSEINQAVVTGSADLQRFGDLVGMTAGQFRTLAKSNPAKAFTDILDAIKAQGQGGILTLQQLGLDGPRALRVISALTGGQANLAQSMNLSSDAYSKNQALTKSSNAAWDDLSSTMQKFRNNIDDIVVRLGGPMAHALNIMFKGVNMVIGPINTFLGMLGPIPGIVAGVGGAVLAVTGIFTSFSIAILAAAGAWRALSGMTGTNALQGFVNGNRGTLGAPTTIFRRRPLDMENRSGPANRIFDFAGGFGTRWGAPPPVDPTIAQRVAGRIGSAGRSVLTFPIRKLGWEAREAADTLKPANIFNYENRNNSKVNPVSMLGFLQSAQRGGSAASNAVGGITGRLSDILGKTGFGMGPRLKVDADVTAAAEKIDEVRKTASSPVSMPVGATGPGAASFVRSGPGVAAGLEEEAAGASRMGMMGMAMRGVGGAVNAMGSLASAVSSVALPLAILAPAGFALYHVFNSLKNSAQDAANNMDDLGTQLAQSSGSTYIKPSSTPPTPTPSDKVSPFSQEERTTATTGPFLSGNAKDISNLKSYSSNRVGAAQLAVQNVIANANSGQALTTTQRQTLREQLIAAYGATNAQNIYSSLNLDGITTAQQAALQGQLLSGTQDDSGLFQPAFHGSGSAMQIMNAVTPIANSFGTNPAQAGLGLIGLQRSLTGLPSGADLASIEHTQHLYDTQADVSGNYANILDIAGQNPDVQKLRSAIGDIVTQLNKGQTGDNQVTGVNTNSIFSVSDFINQLKGGSERAKQLAANLQSVGLNMNDLSGSVVNLTNSMNNSAGQQAINRTAKTAIARQSALMGFSLSDTTNVDYASNIAKLTLGNEVSTPGRLLIDPKAIQGAIDQWRKYEMTISASSPQFETVQNTIAGLNAQLTAQQSIFMTTPQQASYYSDQAQSLISNFGTKGTAGASEADLINQSQASIASSESTLKGYMTQVHEAHIQMQQGEQDFNIQMSHMYRDFNVQQKEAFYQRNMQVKEANYQFSEQLRQMNFSTADIFGNAAQQVNSQYTMGAGSALIGMHQQVDLLQRSKQAIDQLHNMGVSRNAIRLLGLDDPNNVDQAERYISNFASDPKLVAAFNKSIAKRLKIANGLDTDANNSKFRDMRRSFDHTAQLATQAFQHSQQTTIAAFNTELGDFQQSYNIGVQREMQQLNQIGQNLFTSFDQLQQAALRSGLKNIIKYADGIDHAINKVERTANRFANHKYGGGRGAGSGAGTVMHPGTGPRGATAGIGGGSSNGGSSLYYGGGASYAGLDQGVDYTGKYALRAPDDIKITRVDTHSGWPGGTLIAGQLTSGAYKGRYVYFAEAIKPASGLHAGSTLKRGDLIGTVNSSYPGSETGFAKNAYGTAYGNTQEGKNGNAPDPQAVAWAHYVNAGGDPGTHGGGGGHHHKKHHHHHSGSSGGGTTASPSMMTSPTGARGLTSTQLLGARTAQHSSPVSVGTVNNSWSHSNNFTGDISVMSQDPIDMAKKLEQRKRLEALSRPRARR